MSRISRTISILAVCGFVATSALATPVILDNPYGLSIEFINDWGIENWLYWDTDTLETAYDNGQVDISMASAGIAFGAAENLVNGSYDGAGLVMYDTWTAGYSFNPSYDGPRTLGNDAGWGHAMRIGIDGHENSNRYHLEVFYSKTTAPNTPIKLFEVQDLDPDMEWRPYCILVNTDAATQAIGNIDSLFIKSYWVDQETGSLGGGHIKEFNVSLILGEVAEVATAQVDLSMQTATVPSLYNIGYEGWSDITNPTNVALFNDVNVEYLRMEARLSEICGPASGSPLNLDYTVPADEGVGFIDRINVAIANGWTPLIAPSIHGGVFRLPVWFHGEVNDNNNDAWTRYNSDGTKAGGLAEGSQLQEMSDLCQQIAAGLASRGVAGLIWETIYELGHTMPLPAIHYNVANGIRQADATAKFMGPATWPGWTVENVFLKPYLQTYGADLLDYVSVHWYANLGLFDDIITMADTEKLSQLMDVVPSYGQWCKDIKTILDDPSYNPSGKPIEIAFSEYDALSQSAYNDKPGNADWPEYRADADNYINTGYFGGVWNAATLCYMADSDSLDMAFKYQGFDFYGILSVASDQVFYRTPLWYAWKLLQTKANLVEGTRMFHAEVQSQNPKIDIFAVGDMEHPRIILINRSFIDQSVDLTIGGLGSTVENPIANRYIFNEDRSAQFIGPEAVGSPLRGQFSDAPEISPRDIALEMVDELPLIADGDDYTLQLACGPISITVLDVVPEWASTILGWSSTNNMMRLVVSVSGSASGYYPKTTTNLVAGTWGSVAHSDDGVNSFHITNLNYSTLEGTNNVIYVETSDPQRFFGMGGEE